MNHAPSICPCRLKDVDRKWPHRYMYCSKHNYGPMDSWYDCGECADESHDEFEAYKATAEYKEGWRLISAGSYEEGMAKIICPSRRRIVKYYKMSTILKKIPRGAAMAWLNDFN